eukprot:CAMPEP_0175056612 /NCGR_PEP_ID=MMETSP0052_2-20121109/10776_1 /TAXON_ID=51329 ORGANISM="Polytomella parva, Strain SAG 63-3" /NCGR_SAMPLE_ID=MMETSP0052_2 /ASSEMBLY_ACC=CAM_ASM_000194 /LENGTH=484 /DNA_ID=CAMNT_0016321675 /DNA_START=54 /DNA_END=1505 /DNA_ORIENTATION=+
MSGNSLFSSNGRFKLQEPEKLENEEELLVLLREKLGKHVSHDKLIKHIRNARGKLHWAANSYLREEADSLVLGNEDYRRKRRPLTTLSPNLYQSASSSSSYSRVSSLTHSLNDPLRNGLHIEQEEEGKLRVESPCSDNVDGNLMASGVIVSLDTDIVMKDDHCKKRVNITCDHNLDVLSINNEELTSSSIPRNLDISPCLSIGSNHPSNPLPFPSSTPSTASPISCSPPSASSFSASSSPRAYPTSPLASHNATSMDVARDVLLTKGILESVMTFLDLESVCQCSLVSKLFKEVSDSDGVWAALYEKHWSTMSYPTVPDFASSKTLRILDEAVRSGVDPDITTLFPQKSPHVPGFRSRSSRYLMNAHVLRPLRNNMNSSINDMNSSSSNNNSSLSMPGNEEIVPPLPLSLSLSPSPLLPSSLSLSLSPSPLSLSPSPLSLSPSPPLPSPPLLSPPLLPTVEDRPPSRPEEPREGGESREGEEPR